MDSELSTRRRRQQWLATEGWSVAASHYHIVSSLMNTSLSAKLLSLITHARSDYMEILLWNCFLRSPAEPTFHSVRWRQRSLLSRIVVHQHNTTKKYLIICTLYNICTSVERFVKNPDVGRIFSVINLFFYRLFLPIRL